MPKDEGEPAPDILLRLFVDKTPPEALRILAQESTDGSERAGLCLEPGVGRTFREGGSGFGRVATGTPERG